MGWNPDYVVPASGGGLRKFHFLVLLAFDVHDLLRRQWKVRASHDLLDLARAARSHNRSGHGRMTQRPRNGDLPG